MHPCLEAALVHLNKVMMDPGNVYKVRDRVTAAIDEIKRYGNQGDAAAPQAVEPEAPSAPAPETKPRKGAQKK